MPIAPVQLQEQSITPSRPSTGARLSCQRETTRHKCSNPDCLKKALSRGRCFEHGGGVQCANPECNKRAQRKGLCRGHGGFKR
ncbi:hypothetical protein PHMEG_00033152 [Phytophthora megakarya]|uniref:WRKY19-like zinc finger domain-containing protein n=1 Tax=Phytophthora megakarya TaxID=4795 RepID=A0A225UTI6_9STRA|nr:hypothetical protein PHMEG_00033152 [Phytophthora megakarya]